MIAAPVPEQASAGSLRKRFMHFYMYIAVYESRAALRGRRRAGHRGEKRLIPVHDMAEYEKLFIDNLPVDFKKNKVEIGKVYRHFKGNKVLVIAISRNTERINDVSVVYECEDGRIWNRPYNMFISKVDKEKYPDVEQEYRFELLDEVWIEKN